jgi:hypothetical protein
VCEDGMRVGAKRRHGSDATDLGDCEPSGEVGVANNTAATSCRVLIEGDDDHRLHPIDTLCLRLCSELSQAEQPASDATPRRVFPYCLEVSTDGREPVVDASQRSSRAIRRIAPDGLVTTLAGDGISGRGGVDDPRFQAGLDIAAPAGTSGLAVREGVVTQLDGVSAFDTLNEAIRVGPIAHLHLRVGRDANGGPFDDVRFVPTWDATGRLARMRVRPGARFQTGDRLGTVNAFNHSHLNVGWANEERNPAPIPADAVSRTPRLR